MVAVPAWSMMLEMNHLPAKRQYRLRLSLLSLLLLVTCLAMGLGLVTAIGVTSEAVRDMRVAKSENKRLRQDYGGFEVKDTTRVYAKEMRQAWDRDEQLKFRDWAWRVWMPAGKRYTLCYTDGLIGESGLPKPSQSWPLDPGFQTIRLRFDHAPGLGGDSGRWHVRVSIGNESPRYRSTWEMGSPAWPEVVDPRDGQGGVNLGGETVGRFGTVQFDSSNSRPADKRAILQRLRFAPVDMASLPNMNRPVSESIDTSTPAPGFVIWIEPQP